MHEWVLMVAFVGVALGCEREPLDSGRDAFDSEAQITLNVGAMAEDIDFTGPTEVERTASSSGKSITEMRCLMLSGSSALGGPMVLVAGAGVDGFNLGKVEGTIESKYSSGGFFERTFQTDFFPAESDFRFPEASFKIFSEQGSYCNQDGVSMESEVISSVPPIGSEYVAGTVEKKSTYKDCCTGAEITQTVTEHLYHKPVSDVAPPGPAIRETRCCVDVNNVANGDGLVGLHVVRNNSCGDRVFGADTQITGGDSAQTTADNLTQALLAENQANPQCDCRVEQNGEQVSITCRTLEPLNCCVAGTDIPNPGQLFTGAIPIRNLGQLLTSCGGITDTEIQLTCDAGGRTTAAAFLP
ncbi:MAG: hypothetical protein O7E57_06290 [Gammaproteobacteria bacterium]|nr:hypothetical protein [Gammaproteobacteria bacterium]